MRVAARDGRGLWDALSVVLCGAVLAIPLTSSGLWDPFEVDAADAARRIAVHRFGAAHLAVGGDSPAIPTLTDLGMGELPFTSMALSFKLFGLSELAGRGALALWALVGAVALYTLLRRLVDRAAATYALLALVTLPIVFLEARVMVGDIVTMSAFALSVAGLGLALVEPRTGVRVAALAIGVAGLAAGYLSRGLLLGVAAPALAVSVAGLSRTHRAHSPLRSTLACSLLAIGVGATLEWLRLALPEVDVGTVLKRPLGMLLHDPTPRDATFDRFFRLVGHASFPWIGLLPVALAALFRAPHEESDAMDRERFARNLLLAAVGAAYFANTVALPYAGPVVFIGPFALAGAIGLCLRDIDRSDLPMRLSVVVLTAVTFMVYVDLDREPLRSLATFPMEGVTFPPAFGETSSRHLRVIALGFVLTFALFGWGGDGPKIDSSLHESYRAAAQWTSGLRGRLLAARDAIANAWGGLLLLVLVVVEAAFVGLAAMLFLGTRLGWASVTQLSRSWVDTGLKLWWLVPLALAASAALFVAWMDASLALRRRVGLRRGTAMAACFAAVGGYGSFVHYPALFDQLSPQGVFETFKDTGAPAKSLALLGLRPRTAAFYVGPEVSVFEDPGAAYRFLEAEPKDRRFVVLLSRDLARMNALFRASHRENLPVLDGRSSQIFLASNLLGDATNQNPFDALVRSTPARPAHPVAARFGSALESIGWDVTNADGKQVTALTAGKSFKFYFHYKVNRPIFGNWQAFVHIDGQSRRHNGDHLVLGGRYPMNLWQDGDYIRDEHIVDLEPSFLPGKYWLFYGFFNSSGRMRVTDGEAQEDRVVGGVIEVK